MSPQRDWWCDTLATEHCPCKGAETADRKRLAHALTHPIFALVAPAHPLRQGLAKEKSKAALIEVKEKISGAIEQDLEMYSPVYSTLDGLIAKAK